MWSSFFLSFFFCGEILPSALRPLVGQMRNPTSPNGFESLRGFCELQKSTLMLQRRDMWLNARGSHSFTCHPLVYPRMEWAILHAFHKHSPDGVAWAKWRTSGSTYYSYIDPERMKGWVSLFGWFYSRWFKWSPISYKSSVGQGKFTGQIGVSTSEPRSHNIISQKWCQIA